MWGLTQLSLGSTGQTSRKDRLDFSSTGSGRCPQVEFFFFFSSVREASALLSRPFSGLYKTHPDYLG